MLLQTAVLMVRHLLKVLQAEQLMRPLPLLLLQLRLLQWEVPVLRLQVLLQSMLQLQLVPLLHCWVSTQCLLSLQLLMELLVL